jgi:hypothetical protein
MLLVAATVDCLLSMFVMKVIEALVILLLVVVVRERAGADAMMMTTTVTIWVYS